MKKSVSLQMLVVALLSALFLVASCKKEDAGRSNQANSNAASAPETGMYLFVGTWTGTIRVDDIHPNFCTYSGDPITVTQKWSVNNDSSFTIVETLLDFNSTIPWTTTWKGRLYNRDSLSISMSKGINCYGATQTMRTQLNTKILKGQDNKYAITTIVDYPMCPPDCLFYFNYSLKKED